MQIYFAPMEKKKETHLQCDIHFRFTSYISLQIQIMYQ